MKKKIFWSWQSDTDPKSGRYFILSCIKNAIKSLNEVNKNLDEREENFTPNIDQKYEIDHDTKGAKGSIDINNEILRKIKDCDIFIADVTPIIKSENKEIPNPNVMLELGYAMGTIGEERVILVMNATGGNEIKNLPFDIRNRRIIPYSIAENKDEAAKILTDNLKGAITHNLPKPQEDKASFRDVDINSNGIWKTKWPKKVEDENGDITFIQPRILPRLMIRIIPSHIKNTTTIKTLLQTPTECDLYTAIDGGTFGNRGRCDDGYIKFWAGDHWPKNKSDSNKFPDGKSEDTAYPVNNITAYLKENNEIFHAIFSPFEMYNYFDDQKKASSHKIKNHIEQCLIQSDKFLKNIGIEGKLRVVFEMKGLLGTKMQESINLPSREALNDHIIMDEISMDRNEESINLVTGKIMLNIFDLYGVDPHK